MRLEGEATGMAAALQLQLPPDSRLLVARFDSEDGLLLANEAFRRAFGLSEAERPSWTELLRAAHRAGLGLSVEADDFDAWLHSAVLLRRQQAWRAYPANLCDGRWIWVTESLQPDGALLFLACDITALQADGVAGHAAAAASQAGTDAQSGVATRELVMRQLQLALVQADAWPLCVLWLEVDGFRSLPEQGGEAVLGDLGRQLLASVRREDGCGRMAEAAFLMVLPNAGRGQAGAIAERLLTRVRQARLAQGAAYHCSAGLAEAVWGEVAGDLLSRAKSACLAAAAAGGDRLCSGD